METAYEFLEWLDNHPTLREELLEDDAWEQILELAQMYGYQFTEDDWMAVRRVFA
jgi:hypothetical protein